MSNFSYDNKILDTVDSYLLRLLELRDAYTRDHSLRVENHSHKIALHLGLDGEQTYIVDKVARLHDIGKIVIPGSWTNDERKLSKPEYNLIKTHPILGHLLLIFLSYLIPGLWEYRKKIILPVGLGILYHHENYDGNGYPMRLKGDAIPLASRIVRITDEYDSLRTRKNKITHGEALEWLRGASESRLDPQILAIILENNLFTTL